MAPGQSFSSSAPALVPAHVSSPMSYDIRLSPATLNPRVIARKHQASPHILSLQFPLLPSVWSAYFLRAWLTPFPLSRLSSKALTWLNSFRPHTSLLGKHHSCPHSTDEETEARDANERTTRDDMDESHRHNHEPKQKSGADIKREVERQRMKWEISDCLVHRKVSGISWSWGFSADPRCKIFLSQWKRMD